MEKSGEEEGNAVVRTVSMMVMICVEWKQWIQLNLLIVNNVFRAFEMDFENALGKECKNEGRQQNVDQNLWLGGVQIRIKW